MAALRIPWSCLVPFLLLPLTFAFDSLDHKSNVKQWGPFATEQDICVSKEDPLLRILPLEKTNTQRAVDFLVDRNLKARPEVHDVNLTYKEFHNHVQDAFSLARENTFSLVALDPNKDVIGVHLVLRFPQLSQMYSPHPIDEVIAFVKKCYESEMGPPVADVWIRVLEGSQTNLARCQLLRELSMQYLHSKHRTGMLLWSSAKHERTLLRKFGFQLRTCGGKGGPCDWSQLKILPGRASDICLFAL